MKVEDRGDEKILRTTCCPPQCGVQCAALAHVKNGVMTKLEPADYPEPGYRYMCPRALCWPKLVYHPDRLKYPMKRVGKRGEGKWERISWDEALDTIAGKFKDIQAKYGRGSVCVLTGGGLGLPNGALFSGQRWATALGGTFVSSIGNTNAGQGCADNPFFGDRRGHHYLLDQENPRMFVYWGQNIVVTQLWKYCMHVRKAREKGAKMVFISPVFTPTAAKADEWIPLRPGTDTALALGMMNVIMKEGLCDEPFLLEWTVGPFLVRGDNGLFLRDSTGKKYMVWDTKTNKPQTSDTPNIAPALRGSYTVEGIECKTAFQLLAELVEQYPVERASEITEVSPEIIRRFALDYATLKPVISDRGFAIQKGFYGHLAWRAISTLAAVTGNVSLKVPESDIFTALNWGPFLYPGMKVADPTAANYATRDVDVEAMQKSMMTGIRFYEQGRTGKPFPLKAAWISQHNAASAYANRSKLIEILLRMEFTVVVDLFMTATAEYADIVLPGCTTFECTNMALPYAHLYGGGHPFVELQTKVIEPYYESKSDMEIYSLLAPRMGLERFYNMSEEEYLKMLLSSGHPALEGMTVEALKKGPMKPKPYPTPLLHTASGRLEFYVEKMVPFGEQLPVYKEAWESDRQPIAQKYPLYFMTLHSKYHHESMWVNVDWMREVDPEPLLHMNPADAEKRGIRDGDMVVSFNDRGRMKLKARVYEGMRPGTVSVPYGWWPRYFAEGSFNDLTDSRLNPAQQAAYETQSQEQGILVEVKKAEE